MAQLHTQVTGLQRTVRELAQQVTELRRELAEMKKLNEQKSAAEADDEPDPAAAAEPASAGPASADPAPPSLAPSDPARAGATAVEPAPAAETTPELDPDPAPAPVKEVNGSSNGRAVNGLAHTIKVQAEAEVAPAQAEAPAETRPETGGGLFGLKGGLAAAIGGLASGATVEELGVQKDRILITSFGGSSSSARMNNDAAGAADDIRTAEDGTQYWGEIDNESSRARAAGDTLVIDQWECIACGTCVENTDAVFVLPDDAKAVAYRQEGNMELIQDAIDACPVTCIHWTDEPDQFEQTNDAEGVELAG